ncbi:DUF6445 family protein [Rhodanobacter sp. Si-c]|uniref:DUF6445 family protein n=1 Tax=Rhodanobacter lycopersici TaxID=3162487 RepID=A0ABV3QAI1_9GAMM
MSYLVVDNFCEDVEAVRQSALAAGIGTWRPNQGEVGSSVYEGMGFWGEHALMVRALMRATGGIVIPNALFFRSTNVGMEKAYIHSDRESGNHTCICYLTEHPEPYGTAFYRHKRTGLCEMPSFQQMTAMGILDELKADMVSRDPDKWEQLDFVCGAKNRALIFQAPLFHSRMPIEGLGNLPENGRMVWACHFKKLSPTGDFA